jgi:hypothetical protein
MAKSAFLDPHKFAPFADPVLDHLSCLLSFCKKVLTAVEEKRVCRVGAAPAHSVPVKLIAAMQAGLSSHGATAKSPATGIAEGYVSPGEKAWHVLGNFVEFSGNFREVLVL